MSSSPESHFESNWDIADDHGDEDDLTIESVEIQNKESSDDHTPQSRLSESIPTETMSCEDLAEWLNLKGIPNLSVPL